MPGSGNTTLYAAQTAMPFTPDDKDLDLRDNAERIGLGNHSHRVSGGSELDSGFSLNVVLNLFGKCPIIRAVADWMSAPRIGSSEWMTTCLIIRRSANLTL